MELQTAQKIIPYLNHYATEIPEKSASSLRSKAFAANVIAKITYVAIAAICATILAISLLGAAPTGGLSLALIGLVLATPFLAVGSSKIQTLAYQYTNQAETEEAVANELKKIQDWRSTEITQFFVEHGLSPESIPMEELLKINPREPLSLLLPLIARFNYLNRTALEQEERFRTNLHFESDHPQLRIDARKAAIHKHEIEAIPALLDAAVMLQIISQPMQEWDRDEVGRIKDFQERVFDRLLFGNDDYFKFNDPTRPALKLHEIEQDFQAEALRLKLFPL